MNLEDCPDILGHPIYIYLTTSDSFTLQMLEVRLCSGELVYFLSANSILFVKYPDIRESCEVKQKMLLIDLLLKDKYLQ